MEILINLLFALLGVGVSFFCANQVCMSLNCGLKMVKELKALKVIDEAKVKTRLYLNAVINIVLILIVSMLVYGLGGSFSSYLIAFLLFSFFVMRKSGKSKHNMQDFIVAYEKYIDPAYVKKFKYENKINNK